MRDGLSKLFGFIAKIVAIVLVFAFLLYFINQNFPFMGELGTKILAGVYTYGTFVLAGLVALSAIFKLHPIFIIIMILLLVAVAVFMFLPGARDAIFNTIKGA